MIWLKGEVGGRGEGRQVQCGGCRRANPKMRISALFCLFCCLTHGQARRSGWSCTEEPWGHMQLLTECPQVRPLNRSHDAPDSCLWNPVWEPALCLQVVGSSSILGCTPAEPERGAWELRDPDATSAQEERIQSRGGLSRQELRDLLLGGGTCHIALTLGPEEKSWFL